MIGKNVTWKEAAHTFVFQNDTTIQWKGNTFHVGKYLLHQLYKEDGDAYYYWTPDLGIILIKSATWQIQITLHAKNRGLNNRIQALATALNSW